jgi:hypothetical protein
VPESQGAEQGRQVLSLSANVAFEEQLESLQEMHRHDGTPSSIEHEGFMSSEEQQVCTSNELWFEFSVPFELLLMLSIILRSIMSSNSGESTRSISLVSGSSASPALSIFSYRE